MKAEPSSQQAAAVTAVVEAVAAAGATTEATHLLLDAVAGAGKTSTLLEIVRRVRGARILLLAFNSEMARQLEERLPEVSSTDTGCVDVHTVHAYGLQLCNEALARSMDDTRPGKKLCRRCTVDPDKAHRIWRALTGGTGRDPDWVRVRAVVDRWRQDGSPLPPADAMGPRTLAETILAALLADRLVLDQEDQIYHCVQYGLKPKEFYDLILVDEPGSRLVSPGRFWIRPRHRT